jgi:hypothetical protein
VWKGHGRKGQSKVRVLGDLLRQAVRASNEKYDCLYGVVFSAAEPVGELATAQGSTIDFERHDSRAVGNVPRELLGYFDRIPVFDFDFFELCVAPNACIVVVEQRSKTPILRLSDGNDTYAHDAMTLREHKPLIGLLALKLDSIRVEPQRFEVIVSARILMKDMHDHIPEIEQHPVALRQPFDAQATRPVLELEILFDASCNRSDLSIASTAHHDDVVGVIDLASHVDDLDSGCFLVERCLGDFQG